MKQYSLKKMDVLGLPIKKIYYEFETKNTSLSEKYKHIIVHHTGNANTIQKIIDSHVKRKRWASIGYHFLIGKRGQIYYARDLKYSGAHTYGYNKNAIGVALFGNLTLNKPTSKQLESLKLITQTLKKEYKISSVMGHNQAIYKVLQKIFSQAHLKNIDPTTITDDLEYYSFIKDTAAKVIKEYGEKESQSLLKRLKTCPGLHMYKELKKL